MRRKPRTIRRRRIVGHKLGNGRMGHRSGLGTEEELWAACLLVGNVVGIVSVWKEQGYDFMERGQACKVYVVRCECVEDRITEKEDCSRCAGTAGETGQVGRSMLWCLCEGKPNVKCELVKGDTQEVIR